MLNPIVGALSGASSGRLIGPRFSALLRQIQPTEAELTAYYGHRRTLETRLHQQFGTTAVEIIGSHSRGTAIRGASDMDILVRIPSKAAKWGNSLKRSNTVLGQVRVALSDRYTRTDIRRDGQAVVVNFAGGARNVDVVPAIFDRILPGQQGIRMRPLFLIPDGNGDWFHTSPQAHGAYIEDAEQSSRGKLKYAAQLLKFWRHCRAPAIPGSSFHFDMLLAQEGIASGAKTYQVILQDFFDLLGRRGCRALQDPMGISGNIPAAASKPQLCALFNAANTA